jgi:hypothetical protein
VFFTGVGCAGDRKPSENGLKQAKNGETCKSSISSKSSKPSLSSILSKGLYASGGRDMLFAS